MLFDHVFVDVIMSVASWVNFAEDNFAVAHCVMWINCTNNKKYGIEMLKCV